MSSEKYKGKVIWFNSRTGFGFIEWSKDGVAQKDMFCHFSDVMMEGYKNLKKDQLVEFGIGTNNRGEPKAVDIVCL